MRIIKRKIITTILALIGLSIIGFSLLTFIGFFKNQTAGILIESDPKSTVYIDDQEVGKTPFEANIESKDIIIKIKPDIQQDQIIDDYETKLSLVPGIRTIIRRTFSSNEDLIDGETVSFEKISARDSMVSIISVPEKVQIIIDGKTVGYTPTQFNLSAGDHSLVLNLDGYVEKSLPIRVYRGYKLTASVKLAKQNHIPLTDTPE